MQWALGYLYDMQVLVLYVSVKFKTINNRSQHSEI